MLHGRHSHHATLSTLSLQATTALANFLTLPPHLLSPTTGQPSPLWLKAQLHALSSTSIPDVLLRAPVGRRYTLLARFKSAWNPERVERDRAKLCPAHRRLNGCLVREVFDALGAEVGWRVDGVREWIWESRGCYGVDKKLDHAREHVVEEIEALIRRLDGLCQLLGNKEESSERGMRISSDCEACIVAIVGGDADALRDLRAVVRGRTHRRRNKMREPVLAGLVEAWVCALRGEEGEDGTREGVREESEALGRWVKGVRRAVWRAEHRDARGGKRLGRHHRDHHVRHRENQNGARRERRRDSGYGSSAAAIHERENQLEEEYGDQRRRPGGKEGSRYRRTRLCDTILSASAGRRSDDQISGTCEITRCGRERVVDRSRVADDHDSRSLHVRYRDRHSETIFFTNDSTPASINKYHGTSRVDPVEAFVSAYEGDGRQSSDDDELDDPQRLHQRVGGWYDRRKTAHDMNLSIHPALRPPARAEDDDGDEQQEEGKTEEDFMLPSPLGLNRERLGERNQDFDQEDDVLDSAEWTDVSIQSSPTTEQPILEDALEDDYDEQKPSSLPAALLSSLCQQSELSLSSVYSTEGAALPHPAPSMASSAASTVTLTPATYLHPRARATKPAVMAVVEGLELVASPCARAGREDRLSFHDDLGSSVSQRTVKDGRGSLERFWRSTGSRSSQITVRLIDGEGANRSGTRTRSWTSSTFSSTQGASPSSSSAGPRTERDRRSPSFPFVGDRRRVSSSPEKRSPPCVHLMSREPGTVVSLTSANDAKAGVREAREDKKGKESQEGEGAERGRALVRHASVRSRVTAIEKAERSTEGR